MYIQYVHWIYWNEDHMGPLMSLLSSSLLLLVAAGMLVADRDSTLITVHRSNRPLCRYTSLFQPHSKALRLHRSLTQELGESEAKWDNGWVDILCLYHGRASKVGFQFSPRLDMASQGYKHMRWIWVLRFRQAHALNGICPGHIETIFSLFFLTRVPKSYPIPFQLHFKKSIPPFFLWWGKKIRSKRPKKKTHPSAAAFLFAVPILDPLPQVMHLSGIRRTCQFHILHLSDPKRIRGNDEGLNIANTTK